MGTINQGILGGFSGKVGPIVGFRWKSNYYIRARAAKVSNPRTPKQQEQRGKFATAFNFLKTIKPFIRIGYKEFTEKKSAINAAMSYMLKKAITGDGKDIRIDFNRVLVSTGSLMPVFEGRTTVTKRKIAFDWKDNRAWEMRNRMIRPCYWHTTRIKKQQSTTLKPPCAVTDMPDWYSRTTGKVMN